MFICVAMASLFGRGVGGWVEESGGMKKRGYIHNMTTKILQLQRHFLPAAWPDLGHGAQVREETGGTASVLPFLLRRGRK